MEEESEKKEEEVSTVDYKNSHAFLIISRNDNSMVILTLNSQKFPLYVHMFNTNAIWRGSMLLDESFRIIYQVETSTYFRCASNIISVIDTQYGLLWIPCQLNAQRSFEQ